MIELEPRLAACAALVKGDKVADVGTDHAYIPIYLVGNGLCESAVASDINEGPAGRAFENVRAYGLEDKIEVICTPGLEGDAFDGCDGIVIAGMGGELIASIIDAAPICKNSGVHLVLQPMTKAECLREYLWGHGFAVTDDIAVREGERIYQVIAAHFTAENTSYTQAQALVGKPRKGDALYAALIDRTVSKIGVRISGKRRAGQDASAEERLVSELERLK